ncbi:cell-wall agglutinin N-terminal ligand-sugar binding-domain-containing protein [Scheffersomyces coipomensis]|uniref:cell-wall agglutinin N-terminal ligand-sugar binding-domain-containing protein n=1 Tax=Scheffersomyces coipomensis TaxID=1788519 RepID=UPI00315CF422
MKGVDLLLGLVLQLSLALAIPPTDVAYHADTYEYGPFQFPDGAITIADGVDVSIIDNEDNSIIGSLNVGSNSGLYISSVSNTIGLNVDITSDNVLISGVLALNSIGSTFPGTQFYFNVNSFSNEGKFYMASYGGFSQPAQNTLAGSTIYNSGLMVFYQSYNNGPIFLSGTLTNDGQIALYNQILTINSQIVGSGCIIVGPGSEISTNSADFLSGQAIYMSDSTSVVVLTPSEDGQTVTVYGFGNGNTIFLSASYAAVYADYSNTDGTFTIETATYILVIQIGTGYGETSDFSLIGNSLTYPNPPPNPIAGICLVDTSIPLIPGVNGTEYVSTLTTTINGQTYTDDEEIFITSNDEGIYSTSSTLITLTSPYGSSFSSSNVSPSSSYSLATSATSSYVHSKKHRSWKRRSSSSIYASSTSSSSSSSSVSSSPSSRSSSTSSYMSTTSFPSSSSYSSLYSTKYSSTSSGSLTSSYSISSSSPSSSSSSSSVTYSSSTSASSSTKSSTISATASSASISTSSSSSFSVLTLSSVSLPSELSSSTYFSSHSLFSNSSSVLSSSVLSSSSSLGSSSPVLSSSSDESSSIPSTLASTTESTSAESSVTSTTSSSARSSSEESNLASSTESTSTSSSASSSIVSSSVSDSSTVPSSEFSVESETSSTESSTESVPSSIESTTSSITATLSSSGEVPPFSEQSSVSFTSQASSGPTTGVNPPPPVTSPSSSTESRASVTNSVTTVFGAFGSSIPSLTHVNLDASYSSAIPMAPAFNAPIGFSFPNDTHPGDHIRLNLPNVFDLYQGAGGIKKRDDVTLSLTVDGVDYADCIVTMAGTTKNETTLECTVTETISNNPNVNGTITLPLVFNIGGSTSSSDIQAANAFVPGSQVITFNDGLNEISTNVDFVAGAPSPGDPEVLVYASRPEVWNNSENFYILGGNCSSLYGSGELTISVTDGSIDCSSWSAGITNSLNAWYFPTSFETLSSITVSSCSADSIVISYWGVPAGYRPFFSVDADTDGSIAATFNDTNSCIALPLSGSSASEGPTISVGTTVTTETYTTDTVFSSTEVITTVVNGTTELLTTVVDITSEETITTSFTELVGVTTETDTTTSTSGEGREASKSYITADVVLTTTITTTYCPEGEETSITTTEILVTTIETTYCPEDEATATTSATKSYTTVETIITTTLTTTYCPEGEETSITTTEVVVTTLLTTFCPEEAAEESAKAAKTEASIATGIETPAIAIPTSTPSPASETNVAPEGTETEVVNITSTESIGSSSSTSAVTTGSSTASAYEGSANRINYSLSFMLILLASYFF